MPERGSMGSKEEIRIFVGGLSWETTDRDLEDAFSRFGKVTDAQASVSFSLFLVILCCIVGL